MLSRDEFMTGSSAARSRTAAIGERADRGPAASPRLLILTENFYPTNSSGGRLMTTLAEDLVEEGMDVTVLASRGNYRGERRVGRKDSHNGVTIRRVPAGGFRRDWPPGRLVNELILTLGMFFAVLLRRRLDVILVTSSPPFLAPAVALAATIRRAVLVYVVMDVFPEMAAATGLLPRRSVVYRCWDALSRFACQRSSRVVVLGRCMKEVVRRKLGRKALEPFVLPNWADGREIVPLDSSSENPFFVKYPELRWKFIVQYSGNFGRFHDFETILRAAERLKERGDICFVLIGQGARQSWLVSEIDARRLTNVHLLPFQPQEELVYSLAAQSVALVTLERGTEGLCVPSKFYPVLAAGKPVIAVMGRSSEVARVVDEERIGMVVSQYDVDALVSALEKLSTSPEECQAMGERARRVQQLRFDRSGAVVRYYDLLVDLRGSTSRA